jgi:hypothetical protein
VKEAKDVNEPVPGSLDKKGGKKVPSIIKQKVASSSAFFV